MTAPRQSHLARSFDPSARGFPLVASAFVFVVVVHGDPIKAALGFVLAVVALVLPRVREHPGFWWLAAIVMGAWYALDWRLLDNHVALSVYWLLAVAVSLHFGDWDVHLARSARIMIGLVFALAIVWKFRSPDFLSSSFFEYTVIVDPRFEPVARLLGLESAQLSSNRLAVSQGTTAVLASNGNIERFAAVLTAGTLIVEGAIAALWLAPVRLTPMHHISLAAFAVVTYVLVPVVGFGIVLLIMGIATTRDPTTRRRYALGAVALFLYGAVWNAVVL